VPVRAPEPLECKTEPGEEEECCGAGGCYEEENRGVVGRGEGEEQEDC